MDQLNQIGWFLPFLALIIPISLVILFVSGKFVYALLAIAQISGIYFGLRTLMNRLRCTGFSSVQVKIALGPFYLIACFATNILALLSVHILRKFF